MMANNQLCLGIDVIIATYKRYGAVDILVNSLLKQCKSDDFIYVVFQNIEEKKDYNNPKIITLFLTTPNLPSARNLGVKAGHNPILLFLDDDVVPDDNLMDNHRNCYSDLSLGGVAGFVDDPLFDMKNTCPSSFDSSCGKLVQNFSVEKSQYTISVMGANMSFRRDALLKIGGFDTAFKRNALWEEIDFAFRLLKKQYKIWYCATAKVKHLRNSSGGCRVDSKWKYLYHSYANTAYFGCKYIQGRFLKQWIKYWVYRLEYETRKNNPKVNEKLSHDFFCVIASFCGIFSGILRFQMVGEKIGLPSQVFSNQGTAL